MNILYKIHIEWYDKDLNSIDKCAKTFESLEEAIQYINEWKSYIKEYKCKYDSEKSYIELQYSGSDKESIESFINKYTEKGDKHARTIQTNH